MTLDDRLRAAAASLRHSMDDQQIQREYERLDAEYRRCLTSPVQLHRLDGEIASLDMEETAYRLAEQYERQGRLREAASLFARAAQVDVADAAQRLARVLERLGDRGGTQQRARDFAAAHQPAADLSADALADIDCVTTQAQVTSYVDGRLDVVDLAAIRRHLAGCQTCLQAYAEATRPATADTRRDRRPPGNVRRLAFAGPVAGTAAIPTGARAATAVLTDKARRIVGAERQSLAKDLVKRYTAGESIRALAASTGRSYGFVHRVLTESGVQLRQRGGARRSKKA